MPVLKMTPHHHHLIPVQFFTDAQQITPNLLAHNSNNICLNLQFGQGLVGTACFCSMWCLPWDGLEAGGAVVGHLHVLCCSLAVME